MSLVEKICEELGVEIDEEWVGNDGKFYSIGKNGKLTNYIYKEDGRKLYTDWIERVLSGELRPKWEPKEGELYYVPSIKKLKNHRFHEGAWLNDDIDNWYMANNMIFKTKEEAIDCATNMIDLAKHGI